MRCMPMFQELLWHGGEHCVSCWHFKQQTKYANAVEGGELKMYATECSGEFVSNVGMSEPVAKNGFAILPPPECK